MFFMHGLKGVDVTFFIVAAIALALLVALYFLIPLLNAKQARIQRENLRKREIEFNANLQKNKEAREAKIKAELEEADKNSSQEEVKDE